MQYQLHHGDCMEVLRSMPPESVDSIVTDPPYGLTTTKNGSSGFMGMKWDSDVPPVEIWIECLRVLKPGGYLLAFAGTRTQHRMAVRIEDAGFEIRDMIAWVYGSGFPKSRNIANEMKESYNAAVWQGWGTALKPALEPITVARKPLKGTVVANVLVHGTGALNIDGCRVGNDVVETHSRGSTEAHAKRPGEKTTAESGRSTPQNRPEFIGNPRIGRWPANLIHDGSDEVSKLFPVSRSGAMKAGTVRAAQNGPGSVCYGTYGGNATNTAIEASTGSAARFFYCAKISRNDRNEGMASGCTPSVSTNATMRECEDADWPARNGNHHPTVKPTDLMAYLCRLVTPPCGVVLDPFMGSGSTGKAAIREGFNFVGIEREPDYIAIARARIDYEAQKTTDPPADPQPDLFDMSDTNSPP